ncbi:MAG: xanthine dehydrogenase small subunit [Rhizobiaceae bacterium]
MARSEIRFILNGEDVSLSDVRPAETLLDYLRLRRSLRGTKEGCAEGDCGACTVLVGRLAGGELVYEGVNACIRFLGSLDGSHVVTVEHLRRPDGTLHPVQQAMVDYHGSQCGFCTPGFVMSLYALWMREPAPSDAVIEKALQGNLCRCTGYEPIVKAARAFNDYGDAKNDPLAAERAEMASRLAALRDGSRVEIGEGRERLVVPGSLEDLAALLEAEPNATIVSGSTDVGLWVTKHMREIAPVIFIGGVEALREVGEDADSITLGANVSYTEAYRSLGARIPAWRSLLDRIGGDQVRNMGTIGGNIANGSPIGDTPPPLIALGATLTLRKGSETRSLPLEDFFIDYGKQDRRPGEFVQSVTVPLPKAGTHYRVYKITKRRDEDITAVLGAFNVEIADGKVVSARIAYGGMAATPKRAKAVEEALVGQAWSEETIEHAAASLSEDFSPISDMRASAEYRMLAARNLIRRFYLEVAGEDRVTLQRYEEA